MAHEMGLGVLLIGQGGNATTSWSGLRIPALKHFWRGRWREGRHAVASAYRTRGLWGTARGQFAAPLVETVHSLRAPRSSAAPWANLSAIHPRLAARLDLAE